MCLDAKKHSFKSAYWENGDLHLGSPYILAYYGILRMSSIMSIKINYINKMPSMYLWIQSVNKLVSKGLDPYCILRCHSNPLHFV